MYRFLLFLVVAGGWNYASCQVGDYSQTIEQLKEEANIYRFGNSHKADSVLHEGLALASKHKKESDIGYFYRKLVSQKGIEQQLDSAVFYFNQGTSFYWFKRKALGAENMEDKLLLAHLYSELGEAYGSNQRYQKSIEKYRKSAEIYLKYNDSIGVGLVNINLANKYFVQSEFPNAIESYLTAESYVRNTSYEYITAHLMNGISAAYNAMGDVPKALKYAKLFLKEAEKDQRYPQNEIIARLSLARLKLVHDKSTIPQVEKHLSEAKKRIDALGMQYFLPDYASLKAQVLEIDGKFEEALRVLKKYESILQEGQTDALSTFRFRFEEAKCYVALKKWNEAELILEEISGQVDELELLDEGMQISKLLVEIYENSGRYALALEQQRNFQKYYDEILGIQKQKEFREIEENYKSEAQKNQILSQRVRLAQQQQEIRAGKWAMKRQNYFLIIVSLIALAIGLVSWYLLKVNRMKKDRLIKEKALQSKEDKLRISRDLHDHIGAELTLIKSRSDQRIYVSDNSEEKRTLAEISEYSKNAIDQLRKTIWATKNDEITVLELEEKMDAFIRRFGIDFKIEMYAVNRKMSSLVGLYLLRIVQECVQNAVKHSGATSLLVEFSDHYGALQLTVQDNGSGFNPKEVEMGNGLNTIRERMQEIGGVFELQASEKGTVIFLKIPKEKLGP